MSDFIDALVDMLPEHSALKNKDNELRKVLDYSVGAWFDAHDVQDFYEQLFLTSATGKYLDLHGKDYGVYRKVDESDEDYRSRIVFEKLEYLTAQNLQDIYGVGLYVLVDGFNPNDNDLTSDNTYIGSEYMGVADTDTQAIINGKFILGDGVIWFDGTVLDFIINTDNEDILRQYKEVYKFSDCNNYFSEDIMDNRHFLKMKLTLPSVINIFSMFKGCQSLTELELNIPKVTVFTDFLKDCVSLESLILTVDESIVQDIVDYVLNSEVMETLESFIVNGEEITWL